MPAEPLPFKVADLSLAEFGRKEITLAEHEMPGLMAVRAEYARTQPLRSLRNPHKHKFNIFVSRTGACACAAARNRLRSICRHARSRRPAVRDHETGVVRARRKS